ncbi:hypothetical protein [Dissulfurirhabdus thermomarina]|uniref:hypothetical protein n=1 Tax=Dissulfurirhabdus thermomarina TaxID=1765737 RepID=UPI0015E8AEBF|nr:hypothetical protein [Dissulfurirhabdus thermomarina]
MKIHDIRPEIPIPAGERPAAKPGKGDFAAALEQAAAKAGAPDAAPAGGPVAPAAAPDAAAQAALAVGEETLGLLDHIGGLFRDPAVSGKEMRAAADGLSERLDDLRELRDRLPATDPLRGLLDDIGVLAAVEEALLRRGVYG